MKAMPLLDLPPSATGEPIAAPYVRPHPAGGFTHAWSLGGTARIYIGHFPTAAAALRAARLEVNPRVRAALVAARASLNRL